jgi:putative Mg2+ transporter-C (MgtC) family protein
MIFFREAIFIDHLLPCFAAIVCGFLLGFEREQRRKPAGLRSHILICVGSCIFTIMSIAIGKDPSRMAAQIVSGIGFLGGGAILKEGANVRGITTAATVWVVSSIGVMCGAKYYIEAITIAVSTLLILKMGTKVSKYIHAKEQSSKFLISVHFLSLSDELANIKQNIIDELIKHNIKISEFISSSWENIQFFVELQEKNKADSFLLINESLKKAIPTNIESTVKIIDKVNNLEEDFT